MRKMPEYRTYTIGLDPTNMQFSDATLYDQWLAITQGEVKNPAQIIWKQFSGQYIISDLKHKDFLRTTETDEKIVLMCEDENAVVFQVLP